MIKKQPDRKYCRLLIRLKSICPMKPLTSLPLLLQKHQWESRLQIFIPNLQLPVRLQKCPLCTIQNRKSYMRMRIF